MAEVKPGHSLKLSYDPPVTWDLECEGSCISGTDIKKDRSSRLQALKRFGKGKSAGAEAKMRIEVVWLLASPHGTLSYFFRAGIA